MISRGFFYIMEKLNFLQLENAAKDPKLKILNNSWLVLPKDFPELLKKYQPLFLNFANFLSEKISADSHMLPISADEILKSLEKGLGIMLVDPEFLFPIGFAKFYPWELERRSSRFRIGKCLYN
ncbi:MAG: hypothetical protein KatS3mg092_0749 [Patescibacteria group bacterium]|nr:MAG: hypothetical protein KatS3mg092_0749 [Patescibacteria group bacterium]